MINFFQTTELTKKIRKEIFSLWNGEYPVQLNYKNILEFDAYLDGLFDQSHILVFNEANQIVGWYFDFVRDNERWFAIILDSKAQRQNIGTRIVNLAKQQKPELHGWVIDHNNYKKSNGQGYNSPLQFYLKNGFKVQQEDKLEGEKISAVKVRWVNEDI